MNLSNRYQNLYQAITEAKIALRNQGKEVDTTRWQGMEVANKPHSKMWELLHYKFEAPIPSTYTSLNLLVRPNQPWADAHFAERVGGVPTNPGVTYKDWPFYPKNDQKIRDTIFTHTYQERFWPKHAGYNEEMRQAGDEFWQLNSTHQGIRYEYGDLNDVIDLLQSDPTTRQAFLPIWFPEDTGAKHGGRVPCSIGYWFVQRDDTLSVEYTIRACDALRHFQDDVYFACLLVKYILEKLAIKDSKWGEIKPGSLVMNIGSFHVFSQERKLL